LKIKLTTQVKSKDAKYWNRLSKMSLAGVSVPFYGFRPRCLPMKRNRAG
jgi:hypothetical protein